MQPGFLVNLTLLYRFTSLEGRGRIDLFALLNWFPEGLIKAFDMLMNFLKSLEGDVAGSSFPTDCSRKSVFEQSIPQ